MNNLIIVPILIPLITGIVLIFFNNRIKVQRWISFLSAASLIVMAAFLVQRVYTDGILSLPLGDWKAPFGVVLVADMLSALLVLTTSIVSFACLLYSFRSIGVERETFYYYTFFQFLITGIVGAFLTGDIFNLFVFFEVMLISSYVLLVLGGTKIQFRESVKYVLINVISSAFFVIAVGLLYAVTGTLNMAHLSERIAEVGQQGIISVIAILFFIVFGLKAAIFPLFFWLPGSYKAPPSAVTALFGALLTKVGIYSIFRVFTLIFYHEPGFTHHIMAVLAAFTIATGVIGAIAYWDVQKIVIYNIITAVGVIIFGIALSTPDSITGSIFYLIHDMIIKAALFLLVGATVAAAGTSDLKKMGGLIHEYPLLGWLFFIACAALAGIPPLSGFVGKMLIVRGGLDTDYNWIAIVVLMSSLLVLYSVMKIFINGFWGEAKQAHAGEQRSVQGLVLPGAILLSLSIAIGIGAEWMYPYVEKAASDVLNPSLYIQSVLKE